MSDKWHAGFFDAIGCNLGTAFDARVGYRAVNTAVEDAFQALYRDFQTRQKASGLETQ